MHDATRHAPPPAGGGIYWAMRTNWRGPVLFGLAFVALTVGVLLPWVLWETRNQDRAFAAAVAAIDQDRYVTPSDRRYKGPLRETILRSEKGQYYWSILAWSRVEGEWRAAIIHVHVDRSAGYLVRSIDLEPFPGAQARGYRPPPE